MSAMKASELVRKHVEIANGYNTVYMWGCFGMPVTEAIIQEKSRQYPKWYTEERQAAFRKLIGKGYFGFDCVNLTKGILWGWSGNRNAAYGGAKYAANGVPDVSADGMIAKCRYVSATGWNDLIPGEGLWMTGHWGVYIGDGLAVECTPVWENGVQITAVGNIGTKPGYNTRTWKKHGKLPWVDYDEDEGQSAGSGAKPSGSASAVKYSSYRGGTFTEIPFSCIDRIEHIKMESASGETTSSAAIRAKWNGRCPDIVINAELFNYGKYTPASGVKHKGTLEYQGWQPFIGFSGFRTPIREERESVSSDDAVGGYPALVLGGRKSFTVPKGLEGNRYRTAMGLKGETLGILVTQSLVTLDTVADKFVSEGYDFAINLDGGASSSYVLPNSMWARSNKLRGFVAIWLKNGTGNYLSKRQTVTKPSAGTSGKAEAWTQTDKTAAKGVKMRVTASSLNLRAYATTSSAIRATLRSGETVTWYGYQTQSWYYVRTDKGKEGYVSKAYVTRV